MLLWRILLRSFNNSDHDVPRIVRWIKSCLLFMFTMINVSYPTKTPTIIHGQEIGVISAQKRLTKAIHNPEYMLEHWVELPTSPNHQHKKLFRLSLREAILLALRYNPNIQSAELDRIIQRYQLRLAHNAFELQYALAGTAMATNAHYSGVGNGVTKSYLATPEFNLKNKLGTQTSLMMDNNMNVDGNYNYSITFINKTTIITWIWTHRK